MDDDRSSAKQSWHDARIVAWWAKFYQLTAYVTRHGYFPTQRESIGDFKIGQWINFQRKKKGMGRLTTGQIRALETLPGWWWGKVRMWTPRRGMLPPAITCSGEA
jgi:hypothetical protein